jgi:3-deoxy-D-manno-octulosonic-acid transferase
MWKLIYNLLVHAALPLLALVALANGKIRKNFRERLFPRPAPTDRLWVHAASVGEAVIAENLINFMIARGYQGRFLVTTNTYYARDLLRRKLGQNAEVASLPFDVPFSINRFMARSRFAALLIVETEIWPNLIWAARGRGVPVIVVNGRISDQTFASYRRLGFFLKSVFSAVALVIAQSEEHRDRYVAIGVDPLRCLATGNLKYFRELPESVITPSNVVTFGSVKEKELDALLPAVAALKEQHPDLLIFIAPRELHLVTRIEKDLPQRLRVGRFSALRGAALDVDVVVVDTVGDLMGIYAMSRLAFVGGSLAPYGGQNMLEPLFFGTPVLFGPHVENFRDVAAEVLATDAGVQVRNGKELRAEMERLLGDQEARARMGNAGLAIVRRHQGAMEETVRLIMERLWKSSPGL